MTKLITLVLMTGVYLVCLTGWIMNIISIWNYDGQLLAPKFILRVVGVFIPPVGAILGYF